MRFEIYPVYNIQSSENSAVVKCTLNEYFFFFSGVLSVSKSIETNIIFVSTPQFMYKTFGLSKSINISSKQTSNLLLFGCYCLLINFLFYVVEMFFWKKLQSLFRVHNDSHRIFILYISFTTEIAHWSTTGNILSFHLYVLGDSVIEVCVFNYC